MGVAGQPLQWLGGDAPLVLGEVGGGARQHRDLAEGLRHVAAEVGAVGGPDGGDVALGVVAEEHGEALPARGAGGGLADGEEAADATGAADGAGEVGPPGDGADQGDGLRGGVAGVDGDAQAADVGVELDLGAPSAGGEGRGVLAADEAAVGVVAELHLRDAGEVPRLGHAVLRVPRELARGGDGAGDLGVVGEVAVGVVGGVAGSGGDVIGHAVVP